MAGFGYLLTFLVRLVSLFSKVWSQGVVKKRVKMREIKKKVDARGKERERVCDGKRSVGVFGGGTCQ